MAGDGRANRVKVGEISISNEDRCVLIAGPCVLESRDLAFRVAEHLAGLNVERGIPVIFKSSYDKANRTSLSSYRGPGIEKGLEILREVKERFGLPLLTDIHLPEEAVPASQVVDILQIPAFLCRQTDIVVAAGATGLPVNLKKGQFVSPEAMLLVSRKVSGTGVMITERGTCFGHGDLVVDFRGIETMKRGGCPVIFDGTHSVQRPSLGTPTTLGVREFIEPLCRAAAAVGVAGFFLETHPDPSSALCDGPNMIPLAELDRLVVELVELDELRKRGGKVS